MLIVGKPGSSKTTLLLNLICKRGKMYNKKFDKVYLFSPSLGTIDDCPFEELPEDQKFEELSYDLLEAVLDEIKDSGEKVLFIMDDVVNDMKKEFHLEKLLCKVLMKRRHQCGRSHIGIGESDHTALSPNAGFVSVTGGDGGSILAQSSPL